MRPGAIGVPGRAESRSWTGRSSSATTGSRASAGLARISSTSSIRFTYSSSTFGTHHILSASYRLLYVLFVIRHGRRDIVHWNITEHPSAQWVSQQMREAFPYDSASRYLVFDRDATFSAEVAKVVRSMNI